MAYKPKFCCECREKIERTIWRPWTNRRFCQLCATNFGLADTLHIGALVVLSFISIVGIANILQKPDKELLIASSQSSSNYGNGAQQNVSQTNQTANFNKNVAQNFAAVSETARLQPPPISVSANRQETVKQSVSRPVPTPSAPVSFCGAPTKKGSPCTRRVRNGGRCWQHVKQSAAPPLE